MSICLVREYDWDCQEVRYVASTRESAEAFVDSIRNKPCGHEGMHYEDWPIEECIDRANRAANELTIEEWALDSASPITAEA